MNTKQLDQFLNDAKNVLRNQFTNEEFRDIMIDVLLTESEIESLGYINKINDEQKQELISLTRKYNVLENKTTVDLFSLIFEYTLSDANFLGEFYTPKSLVELLPMFLDETLKQDATFVDITCGTGSMLVNANSEDKNNNFFVGFELNKKSSEICCKNFLFNNMYGTVFNLNVLNNNVEQYTRDILNATNRQEKPIFVLANPPYNMKNSEKLKEQFFPLGIPPKHNMNFAFIQIILNILSINKNTKACVIMPNSTLSTTNKAEMAIKSKIIDNDWLDCIITLPNKLFYGTSIPVCLWILDKNKPEERKGNVRFIDATKLKKRINKKQNELTEHDREQIKNIYQNREDYINFSAVISNEKIKTEEYNLTPSKFIEYSTDKQDTEAVVDKMNRLNVELTALFNESEKIQRQILKNMQSVLDEVNKND